MNNYHLRPANTSYLHQLNSLIYQSKAHWGYEKSFLDQFIKDWGLVPQNFEQDLIEVLEVDGVTAGIVHLSTEKDPNEPYLANLFIHPKWIGRGYGKLLWQRAVTYAKQQHWRSFFLYADPNATSFYEHMGASTFDYFESRPGRQIPIMRYSLVY